MTSVDEQLIALSGIQHFSFCRRQWALIHIEKQWEENIHTVEGSIMHNKAHDSTARERRGNTLTIRNLSVKSHELGIVGKCDVVEFHLSDSGISIYGESGLWSPYPVEYKRGKPKSDDSDLLQLCAQAICLEEMLCCHIPEGALYYGETKHRINVELNDVLRKKVKSVCSEMHELIKRGHTPQVKPSNKCRACSLKEVCLPQLSRKESPSQYIDSHLQEDS